jgi:hypothetical protein
MSMLILSAAGRRVAGFSAVNFYYQLICLF